MPQKRKRFNRTGKFYVYIVRCADGTYYTGYTPSLIKRIRLHNAGKGAKYTRMRGPVRLVYTREMGSMSAAMRREHMIKKNGREYKERLIRLFSSRKKLNC